MFELVRKWKGPSKNISGVIKSPAGVPSTQTYTLNFPENPLNFEVSREEFDLCVSRQRADAAPAKIKFPPIMAA